MLDIRPLEAASVEHPKQRRTEVWTRVKSVCLAGPPFGDVIVDHDALIRRTQFGIHFAALRAARLGLRGSVFAALRAAHTSTDREH